jgi:transcriptional regulator with XRE-family HTH domain
MTALGQQLRAARHAAGLSLRDIHALGGPGPAKLSHYENGKQTPQLETLQRLAALLDVEVVVGAGGTKVRKR